MISTPRWSWLLAFLLLVPAPGWAQEEVEEAGDEDVSVTATSGPPPKTLAERIPNYTNPVFVSKGRLEIVPGVGMSLNDPFFDHIMPSIGIAYHVFEWLWIGASADFHVGLANDTPVAGGSVPTPPSYNRPNYSARLELAWSPLYGKLNLLAEKVVHFDTYIAVGGGMLGGTKTGAQFAGSIAIGQHFFVTEWLAVRLDLRDQIFRMNRNPGTTEKTVQSFLSTSLGVAFYLPPSFERERL